LRNTLLLANRKTNDKRLFIVFVFTEGNSEVRALHEI